jgi:hypothetical protein
MADRYRYARQKFEEALGSLVGVGSIQERLAGAVQYLNRLEPHDLPEETRVCFMAVMDSFTRYRGESRGEGSHQASCRKMTAEEGSGVAKKVLEIYARLGLISV